MSTIRQHVDQRARCEPILRRFEEAWRKGPPILHEFLPADSMDRRALLLELVCTDIEYRLKSGMRARVEEYLQRFPELAGDRTAVLELIGVEFGARQDQKDAVAITEYLERFPQHGDALPDQLARVEKPLDSTIGAPNWKAETEPPAPDGVTVPGYEILEELGHGGMGVVYKARQLGLNRLVAIKMIRAGAQASSEDLARLRTEQEAIARLQHPNIIQIHEVSSGRVEGVSTALPCFVMEYVDGGSLSKRLARQPQPPREAAQLIETLARAAHYAHERGIIHRDLKPANILLPLVPDHSSVAKQRQMTNDKGQMTLAKITDFGLAKQIEAEQAQTKTGDVLGTPSYMAPEQARGRTGQVGPRTDVYALGAILYEMVTGRPPFHGETAWDTVEQLLQQNPVAPRALQPKLPRDLETICLKCLQKNPTDRYAAAADLADDLDHFLRNEPICARPVTSVERFLRWCRREFKVAALLAIVLVVLILGLVGVGTLWWHLGRQAEAHFETALREIDDELADFVDREEFALSPQLDQARRERLEKLAKKSQALADERKDDPHLHHTVGKVHHRLGTVYTLLGRHAEAEQALLESISRQTLSATAAERQPQDGQALAKSSTQLASLLLSLGRLREAEARYGEALELFSSLAPSSSEAKADLADALHKLGGLKVMTGRLKEGERDLRSALQIQRSLVEAHPDAPGYGLALAQSETSLAHLSAQLSRVDEAEQFYGGAVARLEKLAARTNAAPVHRVGLARSLSGRARFKEGMLLESESDADLLRIFEIYKRLTEDHPHRIDFRLEMAVAKQHAAGALGRKNSPDFNQGNALMEQNLRDGIREIERLSANFPGVVEHQSRLATALNVLATWLGDQDFYSASWALRLYYRAEATAVHDRANAIWTSLVDQYPAVVPYRGGLASSHQRYGIVLERNGKWQEASRLYLESIATQKQLADLYPEVMSHQSSLSALHNNLGVIHDRRCVLVEKLLHWLPLSPGLAALWRLELEEAERLFRQSVDHGKKAHALNPLHPTSKVLLSEQGFNVVIVLLRTRRYHEAAEWLRESARFHESGTNWPTFQRFFTHLQYCVTQAQRDRTLSPERRADLARLYGDWTLEVASKMATKAAARTDEDVVNYLEKSEDLRHVQDREDFKELCRRIRARQPLK